MLEIRTLGGLRLIENDEVVGMSSRKGEALLVYLAAAPRPQPRESLAEFFWENRPQSQSLNALRVALSNLRKHVGAYLDITRETVALHPDAQVSFDAAVMEAHLAAAREAARAAGDLNPTAVAELTAAVKLYNGEFMQGFFVRESHAFDEWVAVERERLHRAALDAIQQLVTWELQQGNFASGIQTASRWVQLDPLSELAHRQSMRLLAFTGQRGEALRQYQNCVQVLAAELGVTPSEETTAVFEAIKAGELAPLKEAVTHPALTATVGETPPCPYRGLFAFREVDAPFFFGRETFVDHLVGLMPSQTMVTIIGPSGSGKSSVLFAGLVPRLREEGHWTIADFRPGSDPFQALAAALIPLLETEMSETDRLVETRKLARSLQSGDLPLTDALERIVTKDARADRLLLIADQFEELYTLVGDLDEQKRFLDTLLELTQNGGGDPKSHISLVLNLRADFFSQALLHRPIADAMQDSLVVLGPMNREEFTRAIEKPAQLQGIGFEAGLIERILDDLADEPGDLPLLQFALTSLWDHVAGMLLTHQAYDDVGRVQGALARYADQTLAALTPEEQEVARRVFVQLVHPGEGTEDTRRIATNQELGEENWALAQQLADLRLVVTGRDAAGRETAELIHEALIRGWGQLRGWMSEDRIFRVWQEGLRAALRAWETTDRDQDALLRGLRLAEAEGWLADRGGDLSLAEVEFIQVSIDFWEQLQVEQEADRLARERLRRTITVGLGVGLIITLFLAAFAVFQLQIASRERDTAQVALSRQLAAQALNLQNNQYDLALLLGVEALNRGENPETQDALQDILAYYPTWISTLHGHTDRVNNLAFSPDGSLLASASNDGTVRRWDPATALRIGPPLKGHNSLVRAIAYSPDAKTLASGGFDGAIFLWDPLTGLLLSDPLMTGSAVWSLAYDRTGELLAVGGGDGTITLWNTATLAPAGDVLVTGRGAVHSLHFSPSDQILVAATTDGKTLLWDPSSREILNELFLPSEENVTSLCFNPDGTTLVTGGEEGNIFLWDVSSIISGKGEPKILTLTGHEDEVNALAFSPDGGNLASAAADKTIRQWDVLRGTPIGSPMNSHETNVLSLAFSPDGKTLVSGDFSGKIIFWNPYGQGSQVVLENEILALAFSQDGERVFSFSCDLLVGINNCEEPFDLHIWERSTTRLLEEIQVTGQLNDMVKHAEFNEHGNTLGLSIDNAEEFLLLDTTTGKPSAPSMSMSSLNPLDFAFKQDGSTLAIANCTRGTFLLQEPRCEEAEILFFNLISGDFMGESIKGFRKRVSSIVTEPVLIKIAFQPGSPFFWTGDEDGKLLQWDLSDLGERSPSLRMETPISPLVEDTSFLTIDRDGTLLAATDGDAINIWDLEVLSPDNRDPAVTLRLGEEASISQMTFSPEGESFVTGSENGIIVIWDLDEIMRSPGLNIFEFERLRGEPPGAFPGFFLAGHTGSVTSLAFSSDGETLVSGGLDDKIIFWDLGDPRRRACHRANRNLTPEEWEQFFGEEPYRATCPDNP
jgi:WD40 repeat protein/DNA-binding SARP family transcriptional activator